MDLDFVLRHIHLRDVQGFGYFFLGVRHSHAAFIHGQQSVAGVGEPAIAVGTAHFAHIVLPSIFYASYAQHSSNQACSISALRTKISPYELGLGSRNPVTQSKKLRGYDLRSEALEALPQAFCSYLLLTVSGAEQLHILCKTRIAEMLEVDRFRVL
jgi:hypothetical protein